MVLWYVVLALAAFGGQEPAPEIQINVREVLVPALVDGPDGPARNLTREDFTVLDQGVAREVGSFWKEATQPLTVGLVVDVSGSQIELVEQHQADIREFLGSVIGPKDQAFIVTLGTRVKLLADLTGSVADLQAAVERIDEQQTAGVDLGEVCPPRMATSLLGTPSCGGSVIWDAVYAAAKHKMNRVEGRKALVLLSDGDSTGVHTVTDAIEAAQSAGSLVYTIRTLTTGQRFNPALRLAFSTQQGLSRLASQTGGRYYSSRENLAETFSEIEEDLRNIYMLGFSPVSEVPDGKLHKLTVKVRERGYKVRARAAYRDEPAN